MIQKVVAFLFIAALSLPAAADDDAVTVFQNVRVLTMGDAGVLDGATVTVEGDTIKTIGDDEIPAGAHVVDGTGMTLIEHHGTVARLQ